MQRVGNHRRVDHVLDGNHILEHGMRVVLCVVRCRYLDPGELFRSCAMFIHVSVGNHAINIGNHRPKWRFKGVVRRIHGVSMGGVGSRRLGSGSSREGNERNTAFTRVNRLDGVSDVINIRRAPTFRCVDVPQIQAQVLH